MHNTLQLLLACDAACEQHNILLLGTAANCSTDMQLYTFTAVNARVPASVLTFKLHSCQ